MHTQYRLHSSLLLFVFSCFPYQNQASQIQFHTLHIASDASVSECRRPSTSALEVVDRYGACAPPHQNNPPSLAHILHLDQLRADSIQARLNDQLQNANDKRQKANLTVHLQSDLPLDSLHYIVTLNLLNTPQSVPPLSLVLDTGRGLTFTQTCASPRLFDSNSSYSPIECYEVECLDLAMDQWQWPMPFPSPSDICAQSRTCNYVLVNKNSQQVLNTGILSKVNLTVTSTDVIPGFLFGCGHNTPAAPNLFGYGVDGVLGLGRDSKLSFVSQTDDTYHSRFSYCLPSNSSSTGYLTFGKNNTHHNNDTLLFTPFTTPHDRSHYFVDIITITVGETRLPLDYQADLSGTIIESGVKFTRLPPAAYSTMRDEFKRQMGTNYPAAEVFSILDTCYDTTSQTSITAPPVSFTFSNNVTVHLDVSGILYVVNSTLTCFAFAQTSDPGDFAIFASTQQRTLRMVFDVANEMLGLGHNGCP
ncbi:protein aspartic protease in guard cell 2 [Phtheirospermum japonicum]|uniref:Protein aspartic protease in guard cell 2 n=1 Tax=Phtheirospermum japonicum TaxID=374723 RepID=A0A830D2E8_9LAMI|nr:protein aspartic protease in guard cell 2 [Phtheirospermum japonicum]